jgi:beta-barrel assembly-enhancing protease
MILRRPLLPSLALAVIMLSACGPTLQPPTVSPQLLRQEQEAQRELAFKSTVDRQMRLQRIYTPLRIANADLCAPNVSPVTGMIGLDLYSLDPGSREYARRLYGVTDGVKLVDIVAGSPAAVAGLLPGDVITGVAKGAGVMPSTGWTVSALTIADLAKVILSSAGDSITLLVRRGAAAVPSPFSLTPAIGCGFPIELKLDQTFNASADGEKIIVNSGSLGVLSDDRQVAFIVAHELAHNILEHVQKMHGNAAAGAAAGLIFDIGLAVLGVNSGGLGARTGAGVGAKAYSKEFESEADYLGVYLLARAGYDVEAARETLRTMGVEKPSSQLQLYASTHPSTPERAAAMGQSIAEISNKVAAKQTLIPTVLPGQTLRQSAAVTPAVLLKPLPVQIANTTTSAATTQITAAAPSLGAATPSTRVSAKTGRSLAYLYLVKGQIVSNPPQSFTANFDHDSGIASVTLAGNHRVDGTFELFELNESVGAKYRARLLKPETLKPFAGADSRGFAAFSDAGLQLECAFALIKASARGAGTCQDNMGNGYQMVLE